jgi:rhodanese-related sulfurtransferase
MKRQLTREVLALAIAPLFIATISNPGHAQQPNVVRMAESGIKRVATSRTMPIYPAQSVPRKSSGVAVAAIMSGADGRVTNVIVLEAPDEAIAEAVRDALMKWQIPPTTVLGRPELYGVSGKITFYFQFTGGRGRVVNPEDMPGGPKPEPASGPPSSAPGVRSGGPPPTGAAASAAPTPRPAATVVQHTVPADIEIGEADLRQLIATARPTILDIRDRDDFKRGHRDGAVNIPRDELSIRSYIELDHARPLVIDCAQSETNACRNAASQLSRQKFPKVVILLQ